MAWDHGRNRKKRRDRRRWDGVSTHGRAYRIARKQRSRKSARHGRKSAFRSHNYKG